MLSDFCEALLNQKLATLEQLDDAYKLSTKSDKTFTECLKRVAELTDDQLVKTISAEMHIRVSVLKDTNLGGVEMARLLPEELARACRAVPISLANGLLTVAMEEPWNEMIVKGIAGNTSCEISVTVAGASEINAALAKLYPRESVKSLVYRRATEILSRMIDRITTYAKLPLPVPVPAPAPVPPPAPAPAATKPPEKPNYVTMKIFYGTDRQPTGSSKPARFYANARAASETVTFGMCEVSIPLSHKTAHLDTPRHWKFQFRKNPKKFVVLLRVDPLAEADFLQALVEVTRGHSEAFVFVHGFDVSFEDAARRTAQLAHDLHFHGAPILYSWPSKGTLKGYVADGNNVDWTIPHLCQFLELVAAKSGAKAVHLIAHSMGNRAITRALESFAKSSSLKRFNQVILTAPDIDVDVFRQLADAIQRPVARVTLYASSRDWALWTSKQLNMGQRAGDSKPKITIVPGIDTVDASAVDTDLSGHGYYGESRPVLDDVLKLLNFNAPPDKRLLDPVSTLEGTYWAFPA